jgi:hypothetical protein
VSAAWVHRTRHARNVCGARSQSEGGPQTNVEGVEAVGVLGQTDLLEHGLLVDVRGKRQLDDQPVTTRAAEEERLSAKSLGG